MILDKENYLETLCSLFPPIEEIFEHECRLEPDLFLDVLLNCMKNCIISFSITASSSIIISSSIGISSTTISIGSKDNSSSGMAV